MGSWVVTRHPLGPCPSGLNFVPRPVFSPVRQDLISFACCFTVSVMALRAFRRTVSLDVSQLAGSHDRKAVSEYIVDHFVGHNVHAVQFVGTVAKVTFAVEASKQEVISHQAVNIQGVPCAVRGGGPRAQNVIVYNYPVEGPDDLIRRALRSFGVIEDIKFRHWPHMPTIGDGARIVRMVRSQPIPRHMVIGEVRVKIAYAGQQQVCDMCDAPGHIARNCPQRGKCFSCGAEGHFSRNCPQRQIRLDRDEDTAAPDPTPAEAAALAAGARAGPTLSTASLSADTDSLEGVSLPPITGEPAVDPALDAAMDSPASDATPVAGPTPSPSPDLRDNQLDELDSQSLLPSPSPSSAVDPVPSSSPGPGASNIGLLGKLKLKVGLNKKKESTVNLSNTGACLNLSESNDNSTVNTVSKECSSDNSSGNNGNIRSGNDNSITRSKNINDNANSSDSFQNSSVQEYIGQGVLAGREKDSDMELAVDSQKRSHPDSDSIDSVDDDSFAVPVVPPPRPSKKKPAVVVSPGTSRPVVVEQSRGRNRSRSPKRSSSVGRSPSSGSHDLPPSLGYGPKPPRSSRR